MVFSQFSASKLAVATALSAVAFASQAADLSNPSFESSVAGPLTYATSNWGTSGGSEAVVLGGSDGSQFAQLSAGDNIYQAFSSDGAGLYNVNFLANGQGYSSVYLSSDVNAQNFSNAQGTSGSPSTVYGPGWQSATYSFNATANTSYHVFFEGAGTGLGVDGISVTAVPEPETYAMMLAGLGAVGFVARRRKSRSV